MSVKTQGTSVFFADSTATTPAMVRMTAPTGITGPTSGAADQIETTDLDATTVKTFVNGLSSPSPLTIPFVLKPTNADHKRLFELRRSGVAMHWMIGFSDGTTTPTYAAGALTPPTTRSFIGFYGSITELAIDFASNEVVRGTLAIQRTSDFTEHWKA